MSCYKIDVGHLSSETSMPGLHVKEEVREKKKFRFVTCEKEMVPHWCERGHAGYVIEGKLELKFEKEAILFKEGDGIHIPDGLKHRHFFTVIKAPLRMVFVEDV